MIHFGKAPNEDKVLIEVSDADLVHLQAVLTAMPLTERRGEWPKIKELIETDPDLKEWLAGGTKWMNEKGGRHADV